MDELKWPKLWLESQIYHPVQAELMSDDVRFKVVPCGRRSGKSHCAKRFTVLQAMKTPGKYMLSAPTREQAKKIFFKEVGELIPEWFTQKPSSKTELIHYLKNGSEIHVLGLDRPERVEGQNWLGAIIDEVGNTHPEAWPLHLRPAFDTIGLNTWCWLIGTPEGRNHYYDLNEYALNSGDSDWKSYHWKSSEILPAKAIEAAKRQLSPAQYEQEYNASFILQTGVVYADYDNANHTDKVFDPSNKEIIFTHDQNFSPMSSAIMQREGNNVYCVDEIILASASAQDVGFEFVERYRKHTNCLVKIFGDVSGNIGAKHGKQSFYIILEQVLRNAGFRVHNNVPRSNPRIVDGQNSLRSKILNAMGERSFFVNPDKCKTIDKGMRTVSLKEGSTFLEDERNDCQHVLTAIRYYTSRDFPIRHTKVKTQKYWK